MEETEPTPKTETEPVQLPPETYVQEQEPECSKMKKIKCLTINERQKFFVKANRKRHNNWKKCGGNEDIVRIPAKHRELDSTMLNNIAKTEYSKIYPNRRYVRFEKSGIHAWGAYSAKKFIKDEAVVEYTGEVIRYGVTEVRQEYYEQHGNCGSYIFRLGDDQFLDATYRGGVARFLNHSCDPNCQTQIIRSDGKEHVIIYALRDIEEFEELTYDYELPYEPKEKAIRCLCASIKCKGWLNYPQEGSRDEEEFLKTMEAINSGESKDQSDQPMYNET